MGDPQFICLAARIPVDLATIVRPLIEDAHTRAPSAAITLSADNDATVRAATPTHSNACCATSSTTPSPPSNRPGESTYSYEGATATSRRSSPMTPGVPEHEHQRIFERLVRLDPSKPGHGLGLAIARRIAQQHDGDLTWGRRQAEPSFTLSIPSARWTASPGSEGPAET
jgi:two-component system, OmpR family, sensor kinase